MLRQDDRSDQERGQHEEDVDADGPAREVVIAACSSITAAMAIARTPSNAATCCCFAPVTSDAYTAPVRKDSRVQPQLMERPHASRSSTPGTSPDADVRVGTVRTTV